MEESSTYQWILEQGALREVRRLLLAHGHKRFQESPPAAVKTAIAAITDRKRLEDLILRVWDVASWQELLGLPELVRRSKRRKPKS